MGDAELKSNLGERFLATVKVTDIESVPDSICFSATDIGENPSFKRASINLKADNGNYQLTISSSDVVTEPIVNLRVTFHCEPNINREYVLLLDPAPISANEKATTSDDSVHLEQDISHSKKQNRKSRESSSQYSLAPQVAAQGNENSQTQVAIKPPKKKKSNNASSVNEKLNDTYTGKQNNNVAPQSSLQAESKISTDVSEHKASTDKPFLVISAGQTNVTEGTEKPGLSLRLATEIDMSRPDEVQATQSITDAMDEVTVMSNRLAHLEKQIATLQSRNAELMAEAQKSKEENSSFDWLTLLKIAFGILLVIAFFELLRRKFANRAIHIQDTWFDDENPDDTNYKPNKLGANSANEFNAHSIKTPSFEDPKFNETPTHHLNADDTQAISKVEKEEYGSVVEDADVFIEHGRPALAIQLLQNHLSDSPADSPAIWLKLLDLLSKEGSETEYDATVIECNKYFNIKAAKFDSHSSADDSSIEDYPHIVTRLEGVWGSPYAVGFLNDLIFNKRSQPREGLDQGAFNDLFFLKNIANNLEQANPSTFKMNSDESELNQADSTLPVNANLASVAVNNIENTNFNDALFTDNEPLTNIVDTAKDEISDTQPDVKANFNPFNDESSYEVNIIPHDETQPTPKTKDQALEFETPVKAATSKNDEALFLVEEINFSLPTEKVEHAKEHQDNTLDEGIVLDDSEKVTTENNSHLEFALEFPSEDKLKTKSKTKANPAKNQSESNEIEWDLPVVEPETKLKSDN